MNNTDYRLSVGPDSGWQKMGKHKDVTEFNEDQILSAATPVQSISKTADVWSLPGQYLSERVQSKKKW